MHYSFTAIPENAIPRAQNPLFQHLLDTYASESNKVVSTWREFADADLDFRPHPRSSSVREIQTHQLLSERRFFGQFLGTPELPPESPFTELVRSRLNFLALQPESWWLEVVPFFDVRRQRIWIFWRRLLHTAHHRTQLTVYLRLLNKTVPAIYGPTADVSWIGADPTNSVEAAGRS
jgi:hypothetical protein